MSPVEPDGRTVPLSAAAQMRSAEEDLGASRLAERHAAAALLRGGGLEARVHASVAPGDRKPRRDHVIGDSAGWRDVLKKAALVASTEATVFLQGESGTGKE